MNLGSVLIQTTMASQIPITTKKSLGTYLSESFAFPAAVFFLLGVGILHSIENATQLVHGTPKLAASHRTYLR
jgi:hypothetical protein